MPNPINYTAVLTTFNDESTVSRALQSILNQSLEPDEIVIIDDESTDNTLAIIYKITAGNEKIKIFKTEVNAGPANSRNLGVSHSKNEFIVFFDDDDESKVSRAEMQIRGLVDSDLNYVSSEKIYSEKYKIKFINYEFNGKVNTSEFIEDLFIGNKHSNIRFSIPASTLAIRRSTFDHLGGFDNTLTRLEDVDLAIRAAESRLKFSFLSDILVLRVHSIALDKSSSNESTNQINLLNKYESRLNPRKFKQIREWYFIRSYYFNKNYLKLLFKVTYFILKYGLRKEIFLTGINRLKHDKLIKSSL